MLAIIGHVTENAVDTGNDVLINDGRNVLSALLQQIIVQDDDVALNGFIHGVILHAQRIDRCIEIIILIEICNQVLDALIGCIVRNGIDLIAQQHTVGQLGQLIILTVVDLLHANAGLGLDLHDEQNIVFFLALAREACKLFLGVVQEDVILGIFLDVSGDGLHLGKDVIDLLRALQTAVHGADLVTVLFQILIQCIQLALDLVVLLLQVVLLGLRLGDQTAHDHGLGDRLTRFGVLAGLGGCGALEFADLLLELGNAQLFQLGIHTAQRVVDRLQTDGGGIGVLDDLRKIACCIACTCQQACDQLVITAKLFNLACNLCALGAPGLFLALKCTGNDVGQLVVRVHCGKHVCNQRAELHTLLEPFLGKNFVIFTHGAIEHGVGGEQKQYAHAHE